MKLTGIFLLAASLQLSASGISQSVTLKTSKKPLEKVLQELTKQTGYEFLYRSTQLKQANSVTVSVKDMELKTALDLVFKDQPFRYEITNKTIVISPKPGAATSVAYSVIDDVVLPEPPPIIIKGKVTDEKGLPLQGVSVFIKGAAKASITDEKGEYHVELGANDPKALVFSFVGMENKEVKVEGQTEINVSLVPVFTAGQEVVVVGYGTQKKANVTGSVATVKMEEVLGDRPVSTTSTLLQGITPGLQVSMTSGQPGASASFNIRGGTGFSGNTLTSSGPFILVDNVPLNGPLNLLDPNDIETVTVLKDAGSAAIYGARSAFGVIVITTKSGKKNQKTQFNYSNNFVNSTPANLPRKASPLQQVQSWIDGGMPSGYYTGQVLSTWKQLLIDYQNNPGNYPGGYAFQGSTYYQLAPTDAIDQLLGNSALQQMHNLSVSGGSDKTTYRLSFGTTRENGVIVPEANQDRFSRSNFKSLVSSDVNKWINLQLDAGYSISQNTSPFFTNAFSNATSYPSALALDSIPGMAGLIASPKNTILNTAPVTNKYDDIRITARTVLKPLKGLSITGEYTLDNLHNLVTSYDRVPVGLINAYTYTPSNLNASSNFSKTNATTFYKAINIFGTYQRSFNDHNLSFMAGFNQEESNYEQEIVAKTVPISATLPSISTAIGTLTGTDNYAEFSNRGFFGRLNYDYKNKYLFQVNGRYDGSSKFPDGNRWGFFPSFSAGWRVTEEKFMSGLRPVLNDFKLRASLGSVGNQNISNYQYYANMSPSNPYWLNNFATVTTLSTPGIISPNFTWETVQTLDFGFDFGMFKNRLTGTFDWYQRDTKDILTTNPTPLPVTLGTGAPLQNAGSVRTTGFEIQVNWKEKIGKVTYSIGANLYDYQTVVTKAQNASNVLSSLFIGQKMGDIWGYVTDRLYTVNDFVGGTLDANLRNGTLKPGIPKFGGQSPNPGDVMYKDFDTTGSGNGIINSGANTLANPGDRRIIGNNTPRYQFGITGSVSYKNFDFSFVIAGVLKQDQFIENQLTFPNQYQTYGALYTHQTNYWTANNPDSYYGRIYTDVAGGTAQTFNQQVQTRFLLNGAFARVKNITLGYTLPKSVLQKVAISNFHVFCSVENPFTFTHFPPGMYPDVATQGSGAGGGVGYPYLIKTSLGVNISF